MDTGKQSQLYLCFSEKPKLKNMRSVVLLGCAADVEVLPMNDFLKAYSRRNALSLLGQYASFSGISLKTLLGPKYKRSTAKHPVSGLSSTGNTHDSTLAMLRLSKRQEKQIRELSGNKKILHKSSVNRSKKQPLHANPLIYEQFLTKDCVKNANATNPNIEKSLIRSNRRTSASLCKDAERVYKRYNPNFFK